MDDFLAGMARYEAAMAAALGPWFHAPDVARRHKKMGKSAFLFLRATCWRWAAAAPSLCPELMGFPAVASVGDAHAGNFALWRDRHARLVWGLSDFDEAARLPLALDLVRLCASIILADPQANPGPVCADALAGYRDGLDNPAAFVLEREHLWLRDAFAANDDDREAYWRALEAADAADPGPAFVSALRAALPDSDLPVRFARRSAGAGSLGRARFVAAGYYRGGPIAIEAKAALPSCWPIGAEPGLAARMAAGSWRSPDPSLVHGPEFVVRRLAPNSRKLDFERLDKHFRARLVRAMAAELAMVHAPAGADATRIREALVAAPGDWLTPAVIRVADWTVSEFETYRISRDARV